MPTASYDIAIIGCGMAGASLAYELSLNGASVIVIESEAYPAFHTTGRSAAFYMEAYGNDCVRKITQASRDFFDKPPEHFSEHALLKPCGALYLANDQQQPRLQKSYSSFKQHINDCELVQADFIKNKIPHIRQTITQGFWEPHSMEIDVAELLAGYIKLAKQQGVVFQFSQPVKTLQKNSIGWEVNNQIKANTVVNAAGAWADQVAKFAGAKPLGITPKKRTICIAKVDEQYGDVSKWPLSVDIDEQFYFKPEGNNLLITPADETPCHAHDAQAENYDVALGIERIKNVLNMEFSHVLRQWAGLRSFAPDKSPVVGFDPELKNFFWLAGQGGYGIQMAPALAKIGASLALNQDHNRLSNKNFTEDLAFNISPARFH